MSPGARSGGAKIGLNLKISVLCTLRFKVRHSLAANFLSINLSDLALLSIERNQMDKCDFDEVIDKFATVKSRKINLI